MFPLLLLSAICSLASSSVPDQESDHSRLLKVTVSKTPPVSAVLGSSITLACFVSLAETPTAFGRQAVHTVPLVKWSVLSSGLETEILVARGGRVKVSEVYKGRASLPNYFSSSTNLTLRLEGLRYNDSGVYRCMTQQGLEDSYDQVPVKVKGVVFHYRHASSLYAFSFPEAQTACEDIGARMATPAQFLAGYQGGPEPCTAGWVSDQTVRNPIQFPEEGCFGDKEKERGLWNYTGRDPSELWDVFCYVEDVTGKVLYSCTPQHLTFKEAQDYCQAGGTDLATLAQVYAAWNDGLHHCSPGWLADGSVRYPVGDSRENCRGSTPGVKTIYRFSNQTSFPEPHTLHSVYCFQGPKSSPVDDSKECMETKSEKTNGGTMAMMGPLQEIILGQENEPNGGGHVGGQVEDQGTMRNLHTVTSLVDTSSPTDSQNLATPAPESKDAKALMKGAINHEPLAETNLKVLTAISPEMLIGNSKRYRKMNLKSSDPISEMPANSKHNQRVTQTNLENGGINPPNQMAGDGSKHYQDMPATNLESGDLVLLSEITAGDNTHYQHVSQTNLEFNTIVCFNKITGDGSKHYQDMPETNLESGDPVHLSEITAGGSIHQPTPETNMGSDTPTTSSTVPGDNTELSKILPKTNQTTGGTDFKHLGDSSSPGGNTSEARLDGTTVTPNFTQAELTHGEQETSLLSGSPKPSSSKEDMKYEEAMLGKFNETSGTAKSYQDMSVNSGPYPQTSDLVSTTVGAPPEGTAEPFASFSPTKSAMTGDDVKAVYREDNISAPEEFRNTGTLPTQKTESFVTLDYVQTSKSGTDFAQEQSSAALPDSSSPVKQAGQEAVDGSVEIPTGSGDSKEIFLGSFDPVMSSHQSQSADIFAGAESRQKPLGLMWPDSSAPSDDVEASGHAAIESSTGSAVLGGGCFRNPCANGGTCVEVGASAKCLCLPTYGGHLCQTDLAPCDADWQKFQGFCYRHFTDQQAWEEAEQHCRAHGGHLTSVRTPEEQDFIYNNYRDYQWIGLNDRTIEGDFDWSDGSPLLYENWKTGQPDSYFLSGEDCGVMVWQDGGRWSDVPCNYHLSYICKKGTAFCGEPPTLPNTQVFSKGHPHHEVSSMVRYYCVDGFLPRHNPIIKCLPNGQWEEPQFMCVPVNSAEDNQATESQPGRGIIVEDTTTRKAAAEFRDINWNI
ncbi:brevican core protein isoform X2 [Brienomyrus brachyistius]|nr:brevican core protein isoform X2 [Brienomyrus brachyistius]XP_048882763.1 brevican core protein isoform X2 [Brienomyrus brachyistius]XP_048882766.1 brevican core protein isoform X2 [Brienomyrus brachyistius]